MGEACRNSFGCLSHSLGGCTVSLRTTDIGEGGGINAAHCPQRTAGCEMSIGQGHCSAAGKVTVRLQALWFSLQMLATRRARLRGRVSRRLIATATVDLRATRASAAASAVAAAAASAAAAHPVMAHRRAESRSPTSSSTSTTATTTTVTTASHGNTREFPVALAAPTASPVLGDERRIFRASSVFRRLL